MVRDVILGGAGLFVLGLAAAFVRGLLTVAREVDRAEDVAPVPDPRPWMDAAVRTDHAVPPLRGLSNGHPGLCRDPSRRAPHKARPW
jgi:hypothetical protein